VSAPGVDYGEVHGLRTFRCNALSATLTVPGCSKRWRDSQPVPAAVAVKRPPSRRDAGLSRIEFVNIDRDSEAVQGARCAAASLVSCRGCAIGATHAGATVVKYSWLYGAVFCPRCDAGGARMIGSRVCVSCYNREGELKKGKNGRGNCPVELQARAPRPFRMVVMVDGKPTVSVQTVTGAKEAVVQTLRTTKGPLAFAFAGPGVQKASA
jgi:hypothetical protein